MKAITTIVGGIILLTGSSLLTGCSADEVVSNKTTEMKEDRGTDLLDYNLRLGKTQIDSQPGEEVTEFTNIDRDITLVTYPYNDDTYCLEAYFNGDDSIKRHYSSTGQDFSDGGCSE